MPRQNQISKVILKHLFILMTIIIPISADTQDSTYVQSEEPHNRFSMGYDNGISGRYQFNRYWTAGLTISSERWGSLFSISSDSSYRNGSLSTNNLSSIDLFAYIDVIKLFKKWHHFTVRGFASAGGGQYKNTRDIRYYNQEDGTTNVINDEQTAIKVAGRAGLMPGFTYGIITIEMRLGLEGIYSITASPENTPNRSFGEDMNLSLIYPSDLLAGIIVHVALF